MSCATSLLMSHTSFDLFSEIESNCQTHEGLRLLLEKKDERIKHLKEENDRLLEIIAKFKREVFGSKKERWESQEQQVFVFNEAEDLGSKPQPDENGNTANGSDVSVKPFKRKRGKRKPLPDSLPREVKVIELAPEEQVAEDGTPLKPIGKEVSEKLHYEPAQLKVIEIHRIKYGVDGEAVKTAPPEPAVIPKGIATPSLLSSIVTQKYCYGLPFYRQEMIFAELGVHLPRCTQARWVIQSSEAFQPLWNVLEERLMLSPYVACDETTTQVLKEKGRAAESRSYMWVRCTPSDKQKIVLFDYDPSRSGEVAKRLFSDYRGALQVDGYDAYNGVEKQPGVIRLGCNMHSRRYFFDANTGAKQGRPLAEKGLQFYKRLYQIEEKARELSWPERHELRHEEAVPIWDEFKEWVDTTQGKVPPKCKIAQAFGYFTREYPYLTGYLKDGRYEMDNGFAERMIRKFAIGRNNWLFSDTECGAHASALFYSLAITIKINGGEPQRVFTHLFEQAPKAESIDDYERLVDHILSPALIR